MYCNHCGARQPENASFCGECGARLRPIETAPTPDQPEGANRAGSQPEGDREESTPESAARPESQAVPLSTLLSKAPGESPYAAPTDEMIPSTYSSLQRRPDEPYAGDPPKKLKSATRHFMWIVPALLLGVGAGGVYMLHDRESQINEQASALHNEAGELALAGSYDEALAKLDQASALRPEFAAITTDRTLVETAQRIREKLDNVSVQLKKNELDAAEKSLGVLEASLVKRTEPLFEQEKETVSDNRDRLSVLRVKQEVDGLDNVDALAYKLREVEKLDTEEADEVNKLIVSRIVAISMKDAEDLLKDKSFGAAVEEVKQGLRYAEKDESLLALQDRIESEQAAFEAAEQARIERAAQQAEADDLNNRTAAVSVGNMEVTVSEYGDITTTGTVTNTATRPIYGVEISYSAYDADGSYLFSSSTFTSPYYMAPGESGTFTAYDYGWYDYVEIRMDNATWYLE
ncbi:zinc ribbon domain-containing protein [Saccharibacillus endophyticus]|nr:zinc ribbon domain-containing protein [Saccharibacillus endophyticus]